MTEENNVVSETSPTDGLAQDQEPETSEMPRNLIRSSEQPERDDAATEAEWLANNVPSEPLCLRWRYASKSIQLFERHLRSLANYRIGPALRSYLRTRLEWLADNKVWERPEGVVVVTVDPNGDVDAYLADAEPVPQIGIADLDAFEGAVWALAQGRLYCSPAVAELKGACETFSKDLAVTLAASQSYEFVGEPAPSELLEEAEVFVVNDEFGLISVANPDALTAKMQECFEKLWSK